MKPNPYKTPPEGPPHSENFSGNSAKIMTTISGLGFGCMMVVAEKFTLDPVLQKPAQSPIWIMTGLSTGLMAVFGFFMWGLIDGEKYCLQKLKENENQPEGSGVQYMRHSAHAVNAAQKPVLKRYAIGGGLAGLVAALSIFNSLSPDTSADRNISVPPAQNFPGRGGQAIP